MPLRVLCVDDDPDITRIVEIALRSTHGADVTVAHSAEQAFVCLAEGEVPDVILMDVGLPGIDGYEATRALRDDRNRTDIPVVFVTALTQPAERELAREAGGRGFIEKPFDPLTLGDTILTLIHGEQGGCDATNLGR